MGSESLANDGAPSSSASTVTDKPASKQPAAVSVDSGPVQAYAKLEGDHHCYYIRTLQVTMGRRVSRPGQVDIPLGKAKSVSRHHARLFYNFATQRFEIMVFGKNGAFINEQFVEKGVTVPLENRTKIQIGDSSFTFLLPRVTVGQQSASRVNDSSGYISTPQQLEKHSSRSNDAEGNDSQDPSSYPANKDGKPPFSYATLIAQAINSTEDKRMALHEIYNYITTHYPYYQMAQNGWQNSIRHNLSLNKAFVKVPRGDAEPGKGAFWTIDPKAEIQFMNGGMNKRSSKRPASKSSSGNGNDSGSSATPEPRKKIKKEGSDNEEPATTTSSSSGNGGGAATSTAQAAASGKSASTAATPAAAAAIASVAAASTAASIAHSPANTKDTSSSSTSSPTATTNANTSTTTSATNTQQNIQAQIQLQLQSQLQTTIRQHLLDPVRYPLPPSIAQLLPQAIAQLPPHLANQFSATLQSALRAHSNAANANNNTSNSSNNNNNGSGSNNATSNSNVNSNNNNNSNGVEAKPNNTGDKSSSTEPTSTSS